MPEGDSIFRAARTLHRALAGFQVTRFESVFPALTRIADDRPLIGRQIEAVAARGKHLLMTFSGDLILRTHMRMSGSWHLYRPTEAWRRPARDMRIVIGTARMVAVAFSVPIAEFLTHREMSRHRELSALGPDLLDPDPDEAEMHRRLRGQASGAVGDALLNQRVLAGIGNEFKSEILFVARIEPFRSVATLSDAEIEVILATARRLLAENVTEHSLTRRPGFGRRTTRSMNPDAGLWVYGRGGKSCRVCGTPIRVRKTGIDARLTYWCPQCQR